MDLEIATWDIEGAAYKGGAVVDGAYLVATVRRLAVVVAGITQTPAGNPYQIKVPLSGVSEKKRARLFAAFTEAEAAIADVAGDHVQAQGADPVALDAKIAEADIAAKNLAEHTAKVAEKQTELAVLDAEIAAKVAAPA